MGSEWQHLKLSEVAVFSYGKMPKKGKIGTGVYPTYSGYKYQYLYPEYNCDEGDLIVVARGVGGTGDVKLVNKRCYLTNLSIKINLDQSKIDNRSTYFFIALRMLSLRTSSLSNSLKVVCSTLKVSLSIHSFLIASSCLWLSSHAHSSISA